MDLKEVPERTKKYLYHNSHNFLHDCNLFKLDFQLFSFFPFEQMN